MGVRLLLYSRWGSFVHEMRGVTRAEHYQKVNGEDTLELEAPEPLAKGDRVLWRDGGTWREHVVCDGRQSHRGAQDGSWTLEGSLMADLGLAWVHRFVAHDVTAAYVLGELLADGTTWEPGEVDDLGTASVDLDGMSVYDALLKVAGAFGCEVGCELQVGPAGVERRRVCLRKEIGADRGARFDYGFDLDGIERELLDEPVYTAVYGYGARLGTETDGIADRLRVDDGGKPYVEDLGAMELWGLPDGHGGKTHAFGAFEDGRCEDAAELLAKTRAYLAEHSSPAIGYSASIPFASLQGVALGDAIAVVDSAFEPPVRIRTRVGELRRDLLAGTVSTVSFGTVTSLVPDAYARAYRQAASASQAADALGAALAAKVRTEQLEAVRVDVSTLVLSGAGAAATLALGDDGELRLNGRRLVTEEVSDG